MKARKTSKNQTQQDELMNYLHPISILQQKPQYAEREFKRKN